MSSKKRVNRYPHVEHFFPPASQLYNVAPAVNIHPVHSDGQPQRCEEFGRGRRRAREREREREGMKENSHGPALSVTDYCNATPRPRRRRVLPMLATKMRTHSPEG